MGKMRENPRYNVISMRISDDEREQLENLMDKTHLSVSELMRKAMDYFEENYDFSNNYRQAA